MSRLNLFESGEKCLCGRCGVSCKVDPIAGSQAKMLKRGKVPKGLCLNCAVHDWLRNTYPVNLLLARSGPKSLALDHIQKQFEGIMKSQCSDAVPDEIGWQAIIDNWDLPFPTKLKTTSMNPVDQTEIDRAKDKDIPLFGSRPSLIEQKNKRIKKNKIIEEKLKNIFGGDIRIEIS